MYAKAFAIALFIGVWAGTGLGAELAPIRLSLDQLLADPYSYDERTLIIRGIYQTKDHREGPFEVRSYFVCAHETDLSAYENQPPHCVRLTTSGQSAPPPLEDRAEVVMRGDFYVSFCNRSDSICLRPSFKRTWWDHLVSDYYKARRIDVPPRQVIKNFELRNVQVIPHDGGAP